MYVCREGGASRLFYMPWFVPHAAGFRRAPAPIKDLRKAIWALIPTLGKLLLFGACLSRFHVQTLLTYRLGFNKKYCTFTLILLINIVKCSKFPWTEIMNYKCFDMGLRAPWSYMSGFQTASFPKIICIRIRCSNLVTVLTKPEPSQGCSRTFTQISYTPRATLASRSPTPGKADVRLPRKGDSNSHGARPVHLDITMVQWIWTKRLTINNSLSTPVKQVS